MAAQRRRKTPVDVEPELVGEVISGPGVRVNGPPVAVNPSPAELQPGNATSALSPLAAVFAHLPPELAEQVTRWAPVGAGLLDAFRATRAALEAPPPRRRRLR